MDAPPAPRWRLEPRWHRWFDVGLASLLMVQVLAFPAAGVPLSWTLLAAGHVLPLYVRRTRPVAAAAVVGATCLAQLVWVDTPLFSDVAVPVAVYSVARFASTRPALVTLGVGLVGAVVAPIDWLAPYGGTSFGAWVPYVLTLAAVVVAAWALGTSGRTREAWVGAVVERSERVQREAAQQVALAAIEERSRIAREMHDVVAHGLSVIVVQADGARYAAARDPDVAVRTLETLAGTARESLAEMRRLLGLLRSDDTGAAPQPTLADLPALLDDARRAGTAYRVVQEALSNVRKHAGPAAGATVRVDLRPGEAVEVVVADDGRGAGAGDDGRGLGLLGMRERVGVHGGTLEAGPRPGGGFAVRARIPL